MHKNLWPHLALLAVNFFYAANYTVAKLAMPAFIKPYGFVLVRVSVALLLFLIVHALFVRQKVDWADLGKLALCGLFGVAINMSLFFKGLSLTNEINAALIMITTPIMVLIVSAIWLKERITVLKVLGICLGIAGAALLSLFGNLYQGGAGAFWGDVFIFINAISYALYLVLVKPLMKKYHPITVVRWVFTFGLIPIVFIGFGQFTEVNWQNFTPTVWLAVAFVVLFVTFFTYMLNITALKYISPTVVSFYIYLQPILGAAIAISFGKDSLSWIKVVAAVLIFIGVYLVSSTSSNKSSHNANVIKATDN